MWETRHVVARCNSQGPCHGCRKFDVRCGIVRIHVHIGMAPPRRASPKCNRSFRFCAVRLHVAPVIVQAHVLACFKNAKQALTFLLPCDASVDSHTQCLPSMPRPPLVPETLEPMRETVAEVAGCVLDNSLGRSLRRTE
ncbi:hypothetical protein H310_00047 [Aphanomyces invadans]|uniref:Uncharacterized protein n=1 Tax=Aphanomyces invadans TaxID=157072 RepID=A0A024USI2_9STRA|nr:hypothetical protein H310_00047 [Aphanomyces invadans]ETW09456.1 hypothetical protein H310_00047 [Aphanomyces invadans]|eukprot:XP_008860867.1 hypothetical protein H310_00047 [Aphanomyces invadans]